MTAGQYRDQGFTVAFFGGRVHVWKAAHAPMSQPVDRGRWIERQDGWEADDDDALSRMIATRAECCCGTGGVAACDFCLGVRPV
jgi:hypothetical protein